LWGLQDAEPLKKKLFISYILVKKKYLSLFLVVAPKKKNLFSDQGLNLQAAPLNEKRLSQTWIKKELFPD
jgi:hypothetical protein